MVGGFAALAEARPPTRRTRCSSERTRRSISPTLADTVREYLDRPSITSLLGATDKENEQRPGA